MRLKMLRRREFLTLTGAAAVALPLLHASTMGQRDRPRFLPARFGARGDGIADDTLALQRALNAAAQANGVLYLPAGAVFGFSDYLYVYDGVHAVEGGGTLRILPSTKHQVALVLAGRASGSAANVRNCSISGITFDANGKPSLGIYGQNCSNCRITGNRIINHTGAGFGIFIKAFNAGRENASGNVIENNQIIAAPRGSNVGNFGIGLGSEIDFAPFSSSDSFWLANHFAKGPDVFPVGTVVTGNQVNGGYYAINLLGARQSIIERNVCRNNMRSISLQSISSENTISENDLKDMVSSAVVVGYGSSRNSVVNNNISTKFANGEGILQSIVGSKYNVFANNKIEILNGSKPQYHLYCAIQSDYCIFRDNSLKGDVINAYIGVESSWNSKLTIRPHHGVGFGSVVDGFARTGMSSVSITGNRITGTASVPTIFLGQISDRLGAHALKNIEVRGNMLNGSEAAVRTESYEMTRGMMSIR